MINNNRFFKYILLLAVLFVSLPANAATNFGDMCFDCHPTLKQKIINEKAHDPVKEGKCISCHDPHTSKHKGLLNEGKEKICFTCHQDGEAGSFNKAFIHAPVKVGDCFACHDPHSSAHNKLLIKAEKDICFSCHTKKSLISEKGSHPLVKKGDCMICHDPHATDYEGLLKKKSGDLCSECHKVEEEQFTTAHAGYLIGKSNCSSCHELHISNSTALLKIFVHSPMAKMECPACHNQANSENPLALKSVGTELCYTCHQNTKKDFTKVHSHQIGNIDNSCLNCHNPHASNDKNLLYANIDKVCFKCHWDTQARMQAKRIKNRHPDIGKCSSCHMSHGSSNALFLIAQEGGTCSREECHKTSGGFTHPMGPEILDPRNKKEMECLTCHNPMGTGFDYNLRLDPVKDLCEQCHQL